MPEPALLVNHSVSLVRTEGANQVLRSTKTRPCLWTSGPAPQGPNVNSRGSRTHGQSVGGAHDPEGVDPGSGPESSPPSRGRSRCRTTVSLRPTAIDVPPLRGGSSAGNAACAKADLRPRTTYLLDSFREAAAGARKTDGPPGCREGWCRGWLPPPASNWREARRGLTCRSMHPKAR